MKISIKNYKSIGSLLDYKIKPLTILSGNNSSGKSSFLQFLLLLKQTVEIDSTKFPLLLQGKYYTAKSNKDIIKDKDLSNDLEISFSLNKSEFERYEGRIIKSIFDSFPDYSCKIDISFSFKEKSIYINRFVLSYSSAEIDNYFRFHIQDKEPKITIDSNNEYFLKNIYDENPSKFTDIYFSGFFPNSVEVLRYKIIENPKKNEAPIKNEIKSKEFINIDSVKSFFEIFFQDLFYIGPLRIEPQDAYPSTVENDWVGIKGENTAQILEKLNDHIIEAYLPNFENGIITYSKSNLTLLEATNYWMCDIFKFGKKIYSKDVGDSYSIEIINYNNVETSIKHVGFGISQILPIIVQGLLLSKGGTLILEQPEIHLHPKIQSYLFDFLHSLLLQDKNIIIETHSYHFITRMRNRVAEDKTSTLQNKINLTFIEPQKDDLDFNTIKLDELGTYNIFPEDFIESPEIELQAIVKAQMDKRKTKRNEK